MVFPASFADFRSAVSIALFHIFVDMSVSAEVMMAAEDPPTTTGVMHTCIIQFLPLSDTIPFTTRTNSRLAQTQSSMPFLTDGTLAQFFIPLLASLESARIQTQKPGDVELARMRRSLAMFAGYLFFCTHDDFFRFQ